MPVIQDTGVDMAERHAANPDQIKTSLPTGRLIMAALAGGLAVGDGWALGALAGGFGRVEAMGAILAGVAATVAGIAAVLVIGPWNSRSILKWPFIFLAATFAQVTFTLALGLLIYFRTSYGTVGAWLCLVLSFWAVLFGTVRAECSRFGLHGVMGGCSFWLPAMR
jgi:hypothetical protein